MRSFTIVTGKPNPLCEPIHDRMPVILPSSVWSMWLGEVAASADELLRLLCPYPAELMRVYPVGPRVGNIRNDDAELLEPIEETPSQP